MDSRNFHGLLSKPQKIVPENAPSKEILSLGEIGRYDKIVSYNRARAGLTFGIKTAAWKTALSG
ncbi:MAG: hypothetical protein ABSH28_07710 [Acidobacteriota bacterium]